MNLQAIHHGAGGDFRGRGGRQPLFAGQEPWALKKTIRPHEHVLYTYGGRRPGGLPSCASPFMPGLATKLLDLLAVAPDARDFRPSRRRQRACPGDRTSRPAGRCSRAMSTQETGTA